MNQNFDIMLPMLNYTQEQLQEYINIIKTSNISKIIQGELIDLLKTVDEQAKQARAIGWLL